MAGTIVLCDTKSLVTIETPWKFDGVPIKVTINKALVRRFRVACKRAFDYKWDPKRIDSYICRDIRGYPGIKSRHGGAAVDMFSTRPGVPPPGGVWTPTDPITQNVAQCFKDLGFTWGADWNREDQPHIEWSGSYVPPLSPRELGRTWQLHRERLQKVYGKDWKQIVKRNRRRL
jgi:hypothetical protein